MTKPNSKNRFLAHAVLSSTLFVSQLACATTFTGVNGQQNTNAQPDGVVEVLPSGQITNAGTAVLLNSPGGVVITDPNNTFKGFLSIFSTAGKGIDITGANGIVDVGAASGVIAIGGNAISINGAATDTLIFNSGGIASTTHESILNNGANTVITNNSGGVITQSNANISTILSTANNLSIFNSGRIVENFAGGGAATINLQAPFNQIVNQNGGVIENLNNNATAHAIDVVAAASGDIINNQGGLIYTSGTLGGAAIHIFSDTTGNIINAGTLQTAGNAPAISFVEDVNSIINSGKIISGGNSTILAGANVTLPNMLINNGDITNLTLGAAAIDLGSASVKATYVQNDGEVRGNVSLAPADSTGGQNVFFMNGGKILGNVTSNGASTLALQGGTISGNVTGNAAANIFTLSGTNVLGGINGLAGNDIFDVTGGSYGSIDGGNGLDILNFNRTFTSNGFISNVESINVNTGTLTLNNQIINMGDGLGGTGLVIDPGASLNLNASISGQNSISNGGTINVNSPQHISLTGAGTVTNNNGGIIHLKAEANLQISTVAGNGFTGAAGSSLLVDLGSATQYGNMTVSSPGAGSVTLNAGSVIAPQVKGYISHGAVFDIVRNTGLLATTIDNSTLKQSSAVVLFNKSLNSNTQILLTASRNPYQMFAIDPTSGLASALDFAARGDGPTDANLLYLLGQIDGLATASEVTDALIALTPPSNNALVQASFTGMNTAFERINERMYDIHLWMQQQAELNSGVNSGDKFGVLGFWAQALGAHLNQHERDGLDGYDANSGGLALGVDWRYNDCTALGFAISYNKAKVNDHEANPKDENIRSWQGTTYAWIDYANGMYINAIMGLAFNDYDVDRTIRFNQINTVSNASFNGWQFGLQTDAGWFLINSNDYFVTPFARLKYTLLDLDTYAETGSGPLSLRVDNESIDQLLGGVGVKFGKPFTSKHLVFIPEVTTLVSYDFINDGEQSTSSFVGNSLEFATNGIKPGRTAFDLGIGVSTHIDEQSIFTVKYDLELRDKFNANSAYLEYYYLWG